MELKAWNFGTDTCPGSTLRGLGYRLVQGLGTWPAHTEFGVSKLGGLGCRVVAGLLAQLRGLTLEIWVTQISAVTQMSKLSTPNSLRAGHGPKSLRFTASSWACLPSFAKEVGHGFRKVDTRLHGKGQSKLPWRKAG